MAFWIGLYPKPFMQILEQPVNHTIAIVRPDYPQPPVTMTATAQSGSSDSAATQPALPAAADPTKVTH
jgi:hypothetical protein